MPRIEPASVREVAAGAACGAAVSVVRLAASVPQDGQPEIENLDLAVLRAHQVVRLDVAVDDAMLAGVLQAAGRLGDVGTGFGHGQRSTLLDQGRQVGACHVLHDEKMRLAHLLGIEGRDDVGVVQLGRRLDLPAKALHDGWVGQQFLADHLEGDLALHELVLGPVDHAHAAPPDAADQPVARVVGEAGGDAFHFEQPGIACGWCLGLHALVPRAGNLP